MSHPDSILVSTGFPRSLFVFPDAAPSMKQMTARYRLLAILAAGVLLLVTGVRATSMSDTRAVIGGPLALLLASSTDLGPSRDDSAQLTVTLPDSGRPADADRMGKRHTASRVRWRPDDAWAVVEGAAQDRGTAFDVPVNDYRGRKGQVFYASPQQPSVPEPASRRRHRARPNPGLHPASMRRARDSCRWTCRTGD